MKKKISSDEIYKIIAKILKTTPAKVIKIDKLNTNTLGKDTLCPLKLSQETGK